MDTNKATQALESEIEKELKKRVKDITRDSSLAHIILWVSIIASFASAIMVASGQKIFVNNIWLSIIAGIPGLVVLLDKTFDFARRSSSGIMYKIELQELKNDYEFGKINAYRAAQRLQEIIRRHESSFLRIGFMAGERQNIAPEQYYADAPAYKENKTEQQEAANHTAQKSLSTNGISSNGNGVK
ncbi:MAG: hypothetical protein IT249_07795 [Chitinophagaceae bacterium]|nr:hypothetical protein [Chitinophagaceae bacterium]